ncbi:hypothetical protein EVAR_80519_1 [Eumeta japonica]|uniref:Uncharacterized protein n=1 Tax=Eumeta variegata TaxID=151549 RepID=A0A4C1TNQ1_EUMVA|nr:hypothetical protein EVAR_80519_1 [Eumeta japonica]
MGIRLKDGVRRARNSRVYRMRYEDASSASSGRAIACDDVCASGRRPDATGGRRTRVCHGDTRGRRLSLGVYPPASSNWGAPGDLIPKRRAGLRPRGPRRSRARLGTSSCDSSRHVIFETNLMGPAIDLVFVSDAFEVFTL